jgi:hypothetical protein
MITCNYSQSDLFIYGESEISDYREVKSHINIICTLQTTW